jgi:hypothetical protein
VPKLNQFAGSALKFWSDSWFATGLTYAILIGLGYLAWVSTGSPTNWDQAFSSVANVRKYP